MSGLPGTDTVSGTNGQYVFFCGSQQGDVVTAETSVQFVVSLDTPDVAFDVPFQRFRTGHQGSHTVERVVIYGDQRTEGAVCQFSGIVKYEDGLFVRHAVKMGDDNVCQVVIVHIAGDFLSQTNGKAGEKLAGRPFPAFQIDHRIVRADVVQVDQRLCLSASAA